MAVGDILNDPRFPDFIERYHSDPYRFALEVCDMAPSDDQERLFTAMINPNGKTTVVSGTGCFAAGTMMMRSSGDAVAVEDIRHGDRLMGPDGASVRNVLELKRGREPMYRFTYQDGSSHVFNESHILCLVNTYDKNKRMAGDRRTVTVREYLTWNASWKRSHAIYRSGVSRFERQACELPVPPYALGIWLGDGTEQANPATAALRRAGVFGDKHIPDAYRFAPTEDRLELLAGLIDTDGYFDTNGGGFEWVQKCERMARDVVWLARSLGLHATVSECQKGCQTGAVGTYWRLWISRGVERIPVRVQRRMTAGREAAKKDLWHGIQRVEPLGEGDYFGFVLDGDSRFLGYDFTVLHNTGKTAAFARIALWHLLCHPYAIVEGKVEIGSNTYIGAPIIKQVAEGIWKEIADAKLAMLAGPHGWVLDYVQFTATKIYIDGYVDQWFIAQIALQRGKSVSIAGKHRYYQLIMLDEAAGIGDDHMNVVEGTQTSPGNRTILASQGARNAGRFYETHHSLSIDKGGSWLPLEFSSERSPFVTRQWLAERELESGGRNSVEYRIRVLGHFASSSINMLLTRDEIEAAFKPRRIISDDEPFGWMLLGDVAMGEYRDDSVLVFARVIGSGDFGPEARRVEFATIPVCTNSKNEIDFSGDLLNAWRESDNGTLYVDNGGVGATVNKLIERAGGLVTKVDWGKPCFSREYQARYFNLRACCMVRMRDAIRQGRVVMPPNLEKRLHEKIVGQGSRLPYHFSEHGGLRYVMMRKEDMLKEGYKSPDLWDAMSFAFLESATYTPRSGKASAGGAAGGVAAASNRLMAARASMRAELAGDGSDVAVVE